MSKPSGRWTPNGLCSLFVCDIASFGHPSRSDLDRHRVRAALYDGLRRSFDDDGIPFAGCYREDRGDGVLVAVPPSVDTTILLTSLVDRLRAEVRRHNAVSASTAQMQLRLAVHTGIVRSDGEGLVGDDVNLAFRILEADQLKQTLLWTGVDLVLIVSERVYGDVVRHGLGLVDPLEYQEVEVRVKETAVATWIRVPGTRAPTSNEPRSLLTVSDARMIQSADSTTPDPLQPPAITTIADPASDLDAVVERALTIRQLRSKHLRDQIVAELPLALATAIRKQRTNGDRSDISAIVRICRDHEYGLHHLLRVVRQFAGDSTQVEELRKSIDSLRQA